MKDNTELLRIRRQVQAVLNQIDKVLLLREQKEKVAKSSKKWTASQVRAILNEDLEDFFSRDPFLATRKITLKCLISDQVIKVKDLLKVRPSKLLLYRHTGVKFVQAVEHVLMVYGLSLKKR